MASDDWRQQAAAMYQSKREALAIRLDRARRTARRAIAREQEIQQEIKDLDAGAHAFDLFDLADVKADTKVPEPAPPAKSEKPSGDDGGPRVSDIILEALREKYPQAMKAAELRAVVEQRLGRTIHQKTPGMTLYRLAEDFQVRREGHKWFAVMSPSDLTDPTAQVFAEARQRRQIDDLLA